MQQQIQIEQEAESLGDINQLFINSQNKNQAVKIDIVNRHITKQDEIEQNISEHYQQDFDSASSNSLQIKEQFLNIEDIDNPTVEPEGLAQALHQINQDILRIECDQMEDQINQLNQKLRLKMAVAQQQCKDNHTFCQLVNSIKQNQLILEDARQSHADLIQSKLGKQAFSLRYILRQDEDIQQILIEQNKKIKTLISSLNVQISRLKRQIRKNSDMLPLSQEQKLQLYVQFNRLVRQIDEKKHKQQSNNIKLSQLEIKFDELKGKFQQIDSFDYSKESQIYFKFKQLEKKCIEEQLKKSNQIKKNNLTTHQVQNNCSAIARSILQLRKQSYNMSQKVNHLDQKNLIIEKDSERLMAEFHTSKKQTQKKINKREHSTQYFIQSTPPPHKKQTEIKNNIRVNLVPRPRGMSEQSSTFRNINESIIKDQKDTSKQDFLQPKNRKQSQQLNLGQSHTDNILTKPFKLKLPVKTHIKTSQKKLNSSVDVNKQPSIKNIRKQNQSKLSITQRLERIQLLQKEDKLYSQKLYESRGRQSSYQENILGESTHKITEVNRAQKLQIIEKLKEPQQDEQQQYQQTNNQPMHRKSNSLYSKNQERTYLQPAHSYFKKRLVFRQKKISEDYMKMLLARGRKILQLDNESES